MPSSFGFPPLDCCFGTTPSRLHSPTGLKTASVPADDLTVVCNVQSTLMNGLLANPAGFYAMSMLTEGWIANGWQT